MVCLMEAKQAHESAPFVSDATNSTVMHSAGSANQGASKSAALKSSTHFLLFCALHCAPLFGMVRTVLCLDLQIDVNLCVWQERSDT